MGVAHAKNNDQAPETPDELPEGQLEELNEQLRNINSEGGVAFMYALNGRINDNTIVVDENISQYEGCDVVITILGHVTDRRVVSKEKIRDEERITAARNLAGLWKAHNDDQSVEETVRMMRRRRQFDI